MDSIVSHLIRQHFASAVQLGLLVLAVAPTSTWHSPKCKNTAHQVAISVMEGQRQRAAAAHGGDTPGRAGSASSGGDAPMTGSRGDALTPGTADQHVLINVDCDNVIGAAFIKTVLDGVLTQTF